MRREKTETKRKNDGIGTSYRTGIIALVFLVIGFQSALFIHRTAVLEIVRRQERPDTVYVVDTSLARTVIGERGTLAGTSPETCEKYVTEVDGNLQIRVISAKDPVIEKVLEKYSEKKVESFRFNPNTVSGYDLQRLGFSPKQASAIINYRKKGGKFRRKSDFAKSFVVADSVYRRLEPYIDIPKIELNHADSAALDALPGIGGYFARKIIEHRDALGGYSCKEQLMDIWKFDREKFDGLSDLVIVDTAGIPPYPLWTLPEDSLKTHPYIGNYAARGIVLYRNNNPKEKYTLEGLVSAGVIDTSRFEKLKKCRIKPI